MVGMLGDSGLASDRIRVIVEKPFGTDLASARVLNRALHAVFDESQIFRIDHFLGKESVDNILAFRFANGMLEPVWNREHISYVQIDVPETLSIEERAAFYDATGAYRDMIVTHLFQAMAFVAMEPPVSLSAGPLREEKLKVFQAVKPLDVRHVVRGQYEGYRSEPGVAAGSQTDTMVAVRAEVDNWRWHGVPFFLRSGKSMDASRQVVTLGFHQPPMQMFPAHRRDVPAGRRNELVIDFADPGSITIEFLAKVPGPEMSLGQAEMVFTYRTRSPRRSTSAEPPVSVNHCREHWSSKLSRSNPGTRALGAGTWKSANMPLRGWAAGVSGTPSSTVREHQGSIRLPRCTATPVIARTTPTQRTDPISDATPGPRQSGHTAQVSAGRAAMAADPGGGTSGDAACVFEQPPCLRLVIHGAESLG